VGWLVSAYKPTSTTIKATFKIACESYGYGAWAVRGDIQRVSDHKQMNRPSTYCYSTAQYPKSSCTMTVTFTGDLAGSQKYSVVMDGTVTATHFASALWGVGDRSCVSGFDCNPLFHTYYF